MEGPEVLTAQEVADLLRCNLRTVYALLKHGKLHGVRIGQQAGREKGWRIPRAEVERFLLSAERGHPEAAHRDGFTGEEEARELLKKKWDVEPLHVGTPILAWRCAACGTRTFVLEFATRGLNWPEYCCGCGAKATLETMEFEGRYECSQPWAEDRRAAGRRRRTGNEV